MSDDVAGRHVESLLREYGKLSIAQAEQAVEIGHAKEERDDLRADLAALEERLLSALARSEARTVKYIGQVERDCKAFREEYRDDRAAALARSERRKRDNRGIVVAVIAGSATVLASIIAAAAVIVTGGG
jgi:chromosome segregation ATPase